MKEDVISFPMRALSHARTNTRAHSHTHTFLNKYKNLENFWKKPFETFMKTRELFIRGL